MADLPSILGGMAQGFLDFGKSAVDLFGTGGASIADLIESARTGKVTTKNSDDFRKWLYDTNDVKDAAAKGLGTALNGVQTVSDYIPGIGAVTRNPLFNAGQGALGGLADEFKMYGKDYDLGRAGQRAAVGAGGALASTGLADALKGSGNALLKSGTAQGLARGAVGGAIGAGGYTAIDGGSLGDVANSALQGAGMGAALGGTMGALQDFRPAKTYDMALTDEEKAARIATIDDQLSKLDTSTPEGGARYNELIKARAVYDAPADKIQTLYHQTSADSFADFSPERRSAGVMDQGTPSGIFLKETDADIGLPGKNQLMFDVKMENPYEVDSREALANYARSRSKAYADLYDQAVALDEKAANVYDDFTNELQDKYKRYYYEADEAKKAALKKDVDYLLKNIKKLSDEKAAEYKSQGADVARRAQDELNRVLTQDGYDSVILANDKGSFGRNIKSYIALSPYDQMAEVNAPKALENTLADADMVVNSPRYLTDENGNPRTFYHGSPNKNITEFDINQAGKNTMSGEHALYFTDSPEVADEFSYERIPTDSLFVENRGAKGRVYPVNLEMNNPLDLDNLTDAQIDELWPYASYMGSWQGKDVFTRDLKNWRDVNNAQLIKGYLDMDKLASSPYDGFMARMYPNQDNQAREYAVFDNSKIKMLEDVLANDNMAVNSVPETAAVIAGENRSWDELYDMLSKDAGAFENEDRTPITASPSQLRSEIQAIDAKYPNDMPDDIWDKRYGLNQQLKAAEKGYNSPYDYYVGESKKNFRQDFESRPDKYKAKIADIESQAQRQAALGQDIANASPRKLAQFNLIQQKNPAPNETLTWIRSPKDILTWDEAIAGAEGDNAFTWPDYTLEDALRDQKKHSMTVYSSYPIKGGTFVTPSRQQASDYAGGGRVYSKVIRPDDVAWINGDEGQYAYTRKK